MGLSTNKSKIDLSGFDEAVGKEQKLDLSGFDEAVSKKKVQSAEVASPTPTAGVSGTGLKPSPAPKPKNVEIFNTKEFSGQTAKQKAFTSTFGKPSVTGPIGEAKLKQDDINFVVEQAIGSAKKKYGASFEKNFYDPNGGVNKQFTKSYLDDYLGYVGYTGTKTNLNDADKRAIGLRFDGLLNTEKAPSPVKLDQFSRNLAKAAVNMQKNAAIQQAATPEEKQKIEKIYSAYTPKPKEEPKSIMFMDEKEKEKPVKDMYVSTKGVLSDDVMELMTPEMIQKTHSFLMTNEGEYMKNIVYGTGGSLESQLELVSKAMKPKFDDAMGQLQYYIDNGSIQALDQMAKLSTNLNMYDAQLQILKKQIDAYVPSELTPEEKKQFDIDKSNFQLKETELKDLSGRYKVLDEKLSPVFDQLSQLKPYAEAGDQNSIIKFQKLVEDYRTDIEQYQALVPELQRIQDERNVAMQVVNKYAASAKDITAYNQYKQSIDKYNALVNQASPLLNQYKELSARLPEEDVNKIFNLISTTDNIINFGKKSDKLRNSNINLLDYMSIGLPEQDYVIRNILTPAIESFSEFTLKGVSGVMRGTSDFLEMVTGKPEDYYSGADFYADFISKGYDLTGDIWTNDILPGYRRKDFIDPLTGDYIWTPQSVVVGTFEQFGQLAGAALGTQALMGSAMGFNAAVVAPMFFATYDDNKELAKQLGYQGSEATSAGVLFSLIEGTSELIFPDIKLFQGGAKKELFRIFMNNYSEGGSRVAIKSILEAIVKENSEEVAVEIGKYLTTLITRMGNSENKQYNISGSDLLQTFVFTTLAAGGPSVVQSVAMSSKNFNAAAKFEMAKDLETSFQMIDTYNTLGKIDDAKATKLKTELNAISAVQGQMPTDIIVPKRIAISNIYAQRAELQKQLDDSRISPEIKAGIKKMLSNTDNAIAAIMMADDVQFATEWNKSVREETATVMETFNNEVAPPVTEEQMSRQDQTRMQILGDIFGDTTVQREADALEQRMANAEEISVEEVNKVLDGLYAQVESIMDNYFDNPAGKQYAQALLDKIDKIKGYELTTGTKTDVITERQAVQVARNAVAKEANVINLARAPRAKATITTEDGTTGTYSIEVSGDGTITFEQRGAEPIQVGNTADVNKTAKIVETQMNENGLPTSVTFSIVDKDGKTNTIRVDAKGRMNPARLLDLAIAIRANEVGTVDPTAFDEAYAEVTKEITTKTYPNAVQVETTGEVPVQPEAVRGTEDQEGQPQAEPQAPTQEGQEVNQAMKVNAANLERTYETLDKIYEAKQISQAVQNVTNLFVKSGLKVQVIEDENEYMRIAGAESQGLFNSEDGIIYYNPSKFQENWGKTIVYHEGVHPIINIIRNTNPELYNSMRDGLVKLSKTNMGVKAAFDFAKANSVNNNPESIEDEQIVETISQIASGKININEVPQTLMDKIVEFLNTISNSMGLGRPFKQNDIKSAASIARQITKALQTGKGLEGIVGKGREKEFGFKGAQPRMVAVAPFFDTKVKNVQEADTLRTTDKYREFVNMIDNLANEMGFKAEIMDQIGGYKNDSGDNIVEVSLIVDLKKASIEDAVDFAAMASLISPDIQESAIAFKNVRNNSTRQNARAYYMTVDNIDGAIEALKKAGIENYSIDQKKMTVTFIDVIEFTDPTLMDKVGVFTSELNKNKIKYGKLKNKPIQSVFVDKGVREKSIGGLRKKWTGRKRTGKDLGNLIARAEKRDRAGRKTRGVYSPLEGTPSVPGINGPDPRIVDVAERYARKNGIDLKRQAEYVKITEGFSKRLAQAYADMKHDPQNPVVKRHYEELIRQTIAQYEALVEAGYKFWFIDMSKPSNVDYVESPYNALRDLRKNQQMGVFPTTEGFGSSDLDVNDNPLLADTGFMWPVGGLEGEMKPVLANDLFRAVHDAFGHGLEGAGFRARGEENAWQAHVRLFTGDAVGALTSETRGQNSWLNYGPYGEKNRAAKVEDTVFADQKTGLMPEWTWKENVAPSEERIDQFSPAATRGTIPLDDATRTIVEKTKGITPKSMSDVVQALSDGDRVFGYYEMDEEIEEIPSILVAGWYDLGDIKIIPYDKFDTTLKSDKQFSPMAARGLMNADQVARIQYPLHVQLVNDAMAAYDLGVRNYRHFADYMNTPETTYVSMAWDDAVRIKRGKKPFISISNPQEGLVQYKNWLRSLNKIEDRNVERNKEKRREWIRKFYEKTFDSKAEFFRALAEQNGEAWNIVAAYTHVIGGQAAKADYLGNVFMSAVFDGLSDKEEYLVNNQKYSSRELLNRFLIRFRVIEVQRKMEDKFNEFELLNVAISYETDPVKKQQLINKRDDIKDYLNRNQVLSYDKSTRTYSLGNYNFTAGLTAGFAQQDIDEVTRLYPTLASDLIRRTEAYSAAWNELLKKQLDNGLISQESYDEMVKYKYVPMKNIAYMLSEVVYGDELRIGKNNEELIMRLSGGSEEDISMEFDELLKFGTYMTYRKIAQNNAAKELYNTVVNNPENTAFYIPYVESTDKYGNETAWKIDDKNEGIIAVYIDGVKKGIATNRFVANGWKGANKVLPTLDESLGLIFMTTPFRAITTNLNPGFAMAQLLLDMPQAILASEAYSSATWGAGAILFNDFKLMGGKALNKIARKMNLTSNMSTEWDQLYEEAVQYGALVSFSKGGKPMEFGEKSWLSNKLATIGNGFAQYRDKVETFNSAVEHSTRLVIYKKMKDRLEARYKKANNGAAPTGKALDDIRTRAAAESLNVLNYNRGGTLVKPLNNAFAYLNVGFQVFYSNAQYMKKNPYQFTFKAMELTTWGVLNAVLAYTMASDDDKRKYRQYYSELSSFERRNYWHVINPNRDSNDKNTFFLRFKKPTILLGLINTTEAYALYKVGATTTSLPDYIKKDLLLDMLDMQPFKGGIVSSIPTLNAAFLYYGNYDTYRYQKVVFKEETTRDWQEGIDDPTVGRFYKYVAQLGMENRIEQEGLISPMRMDRAIKGLVGNYETNPTTAWPLSGLNQIMLAMSGDYEKVYQAGPDEPEKTFGSILIEGIGFHKRFMTRIPKSPEQLIDIKNERLKIKNALDYELKRTVDQIINENPSREERVKLLKDHWQSRKKYFETTYSIEDYARSLSNALTYLDNYDWIDKTKIDWLGQFVFAQNSDLKKEIYTFYTKNMTLEEKKSVLRAMVQRQIKTGKTIIPSDLIKFMTMDIENSQK